MDRPFILAFDTSGPYCASALLAGRTVIAQTVQEMKKGQAERLMFVLEDMLNQNALSYQNLDALAVGTGPGNFTGIRIGVSAARGLALGLGIPAYGVNGFEQRALLEPQKDVHSIPAPRDQRYVRTADGASLISPEAFEQAGYAQPIEHAADRLAASIALVARNRWPNAATPPAPYYLRAPDAAPAKNGAPTLLP